MEKQRNSGLELLKIICMFLIIAHHYSVHGGYSDLNFNTLSLGTMFIQILSLFGKVSCGVFVLISGYFLINSNKENHYRKIVNLILQMFFYSILIWIIVYCFKLQTVSFKDTIKAFLPILYGNWYVIYYIILYMFIPFINPFLRNISKSQYTKLIFFILLIWSIIPTFTNSWSFSNLDFFLAMYLLGAYIKLHIYEKKEYNNNLNLIIGVLSAFLLILSTVTFDCIGYVTKNNIFIENATYFSSINSILSVICSIFIFMYFSNLKFKNKMINSIAASTLGIYLIHDNKLLRTYIWTKIFPNIEYINFPYFHAPIKIIIIFIVCFIIDYIRRITIERLLNNWLEKNCNNILNRINNKIPKKINNLLFK